MKKEIISIITYLVLVQLIIPNCFFAQVDTSAMNAAFRQIKSEFDQMHFRKADELSNQLLKKIQQKDSFSIATRIAIKNIQAMIHYQESHYEKSIEINKEVLQITKTNYPPDSKEWALAYYQMAWIYEQAFDLDNWGNYLDTAAILFQKSFPANDCWHGRIYQIRARRNYYSFGLPDTTLAYLNKALHIYQHCPGGTPKNLYDIHKVYYDVYLQKRQFDSAGYYLAKQKEYVKTQNSPIWQVQRGWNELSQAHLYRLDGHYEKAIAHYKFARGIFEKADNDTVPLLNADLYAALCMNGMGKYPEALTAFRDVIALRNKYAGISMDVTGLIYEGAAEAFSSAGRCDSAILYAQKALDAFYNVIDPGNIKLLSLYRLYAHCLSQTGKLRQADSILAFSLNIVTSVFSADHPSAIQIRLEQSNVAINAGKFDKAKTILDNLTDNTLLIQFPELGYEHALFSASLITKQNGNNKLSPSVRKELIRLIYLALDKFREVRNQFVSEEARSRTVATSISGIHSFMPELFNDYIREPGDALFSLMLQLSESHRGLILSEAIVQSEAYKLAGIPVELQNEERKTKYELNRIRKKIDQEYMRAMPKKAYITQLLADQISLQDKFDHLIEEFQQNYPAYYHAKFAQDIIDVNEIQESLAENEIIIEYLVAEDDIYSFVITKSAKEITKNDRVPMLMQTASDFVDLISNNKEYDDRYPKLNKWGYELYEQLIKPHSRFLKDGSSLIIIPDRFLFYLPFELLNSQKMTDGIHPEHFLIYQYPVQYQCSLPLWMDQWKNENAYVNNTLVMSPSFTQGNFGLGRGGLASLEYAIEESNNVHEFFKGKWLSEDRASKSNFLQYASDMDMIHLATHAKADDRSGDFSWLAFSSSTKDSLLYLDEIYGLPLDAQMVVLSGCETGIGPLQSGEGLISLSRAFSYAGAKSIITSLWPVNDKATSDIMTAFYKYLKEGEPKHRALQMAKIDYLKNIHDPSQADPYYWAGFIAMGDMSPLVFRNNSYFLWIGLAVILFVAALIWYVKGVREVKSEKRKVKN